MNQEEFDNSEYVEILGEFMPKSMYENFASMISPAIKGFSFICAPSDFICPICLESENVSVVLTECDHMYHVKCIENWMNVNNNCPLCRNIMPGCNKKIVEEMLLAVKEEIKTAILKSWWNKLDGLSQEEIEKVKTHMQAFVNNEGWKTINPSSRFSDFLQNLDIITVQDENVIKQFMKNPDQYIIDISDKLTAHRFSIDIDVDINPNEDLQIPLHKIFHLYCNILSESPLINLKVITESNVEIDLNKMSAIPVYATENCALIAKNTSSEHIVSRISFDVLMLDNNALTFTDFQCGPYTIQEGYIKVL